MRTQLPLLLTCLAALFGCGQPPAADRPPGGAAAVASPSPSPVNRPREISFDDIKLEMEKGDPFSRNLLPESIEALAGRPVRIRGYILPSFQQTGLTQFVLVRDNQECCYGSGAALHDCIVVRMRPGKTAEFSIRPVAVAGTFQIEELRAPDGTHLAIYALEGDEVK
jgi:hypothetical protein